MEQEFANPTCATSPQRASGGGGRGLPSSRRPPPPHEICLLFIALERDVGCPLPPPPFLPSQAQRCPIGVWWVPAGTAASLWLAPNPGWFRSLGRCGTLRGRGVRAAASLPGPVLLRESILDVEVTAVELQGSKPSVVQGHRLLHVGDALTCSQNRRMGSAVLEKGLAQQCGAPAGQPVGVHRVPAEAKPGAGSALLGLAGHQRHAGAEAAY